MNEDCEKIHKYWYGFSSYFGEKYGFGPDGMVDTTKLAGYDCMLELEKYVELHPEIVLIHVDDAVFAGSYFVLIPHPEFGITVIFIPQCTTVQSQMFLYPGYSKMLIEEITKMEEKYNI